MNTLPPQRHCEEAMALADAAIQEIDTCGETKRFYIKAYKKNE